jgi:selT/selW/selH-like putative selenoprotein
VAELTAKYGADKVQTELIKGSGGQFEIVLDGKLIYSKKEKGKFPSYGEVPLLIDMEVMNR